MRASVVIASSVNAASRNVHIDDGDLEVYLARGARPVKPPRRIVKPHRYEEFPRSTRHKIIDGEGPMVEQIPFPRSDTPPAASVSTISREETLPRRTANTATGATDVVPQEGVFMRCFSFLKHIGVNLVMPPYTIDEGLDNNISVKQVPLSPPATKIPLV